MPTREICDTQLATIHTAAATEIFARCAPIASGTSKNGCRVQTRVLYESLAQALDQASADLGHVVIEKAFFRNVATGFDDFQQERREAYRKRGVTGDRLPATTCLQQPPCRPGPEIARIEIMKTPTLNEAPDYGSAFSRGMKMALPEQTYLFISGTASVNEEGATVHTEDVRGQIERMLRNVEQLLQPHGAGWDDLVQAVHF